MAWSDSSNKAANGAKPSDDFSEQHLPSSSIIILIADQLLKDDSQTHKEEVQKLFPLPLSGVLKAGHLNWQHKIFFYI